MSDPFAKYQAMPATELTPSRALVVRTPSWTDGVKAIRRYEEQTICRTEPGEITLYGFTRDWLERYAIIYGDEIRVGPYRFTLIGYNVMKDLVIGRIGS